MKKYCEKPKEGEQSIKFSMPVLDVKTRWNNTFAMFQRAFRLDPALDKMWQNCPDLKQFKINENSWEGLERVLKFLEDFKTMSVLLSSENKPTLPAVIVYMNLLLENVEKTTFDLDALPDRSRTDVALLRAFEAGRDKLIEYYTKLEILCIAINRSAA